jgi:mercuric ion transport protein
VSVKRGLLIVSGLITCPCHLPLVLPLLGVALAGTAVGTFIQNHLWGIGIAATLYFIFVVLYVLKKWSRNTQFDMISGDEGQ